MVNRIIQALMVAIVVLFVSSFGGSIEGRLLPVTDRATITKMEAVDRTSTRIWGHFNILRPACDFHSLLWLLGTPARNSLAILDFEEGTKARPAGLTEFGPWVVQLSKKQITEQSFAIAQHQCHPLWLTETKFYPEEK